MGYIFYMSDQVITKLKKVRGQVDGIIKMYEECRECSDVLTQIAAARAALAGVGRDLLSSEAVSCVRDRKHGQLDKLLKQLFEIS